ncbi:MAG: hypothetical protein K8S98_08925 [Planctomycetes bacterium]|nr:hypothetical protein [Planctomycetota bacterium]
MFAAVSGFVAGWFLRTPVGRASLSVGQPNDADPATNSSRVLPAFELAPAAPRVSVEADAAEPNAPIVDSPDPPTLRDALAILDEALAARGKHPKDEATLRAEYADWSLDMLRVADFALSRRMQAEANRISAELMASGRYETQVVAAGERVASPSTSRDESVVAFGFSIEPGDGFSTIKTAKIEPGEYPEFDALKMEAQWVGSYVRHLENQ